MAYSISIHALRVEGDMDIRKFSATGIISIHALRVEGDDLANKTCYYINISIHALRVEGDRALALYDTRVPPFLSTPSGWRATFFAHRRGR